jgi:hypothetical protein
VKNQTLIRKGNRKIKKKKKPGYPYTKDSETKEYVNKSKKRGKQIIEYGSI